MHRWSMELHGHAKAKDSPRQSREAEEGRDVFREVPLRYLGKQKYQIKQKSLSHLWCPPSAVLNLVYNIDIIIYLFMLWFSVVMLLFLSFCFRVHLVLADAICVSNAIKDYMYDAWSPSSRLCQ